MLGGEAVQGLALTLGQDVVEPFGDADRRVEVPDLGLVVPEHRQPAVAAQAVPSQLEDLADAPSGDDGGLPDVAHPQVQDVAVSQASQVALIRQRAVAAYQDQLAGQREKRGIAAAKKAAADKRRGSLHAVS